MEIHWCYDWVLLIALKNLLTLVLAPKTAQVCLRHLDGYTGGSYAQSVAPLVQSAKSSPYGEK
jgi:hypothetical protein